MFFSPFFGWNPCFYSVFSKNAKFKETQKRKKRLFVSTPVLTALVKMSFFCAFFIFGFFCNFQFFQKCFLIGSQNSKNTKYESNKNQKQQEEENKIQSKNKSNMMIQNKRRQQAEKEKQHNILNQEANQTKRKRKNQKERWKTGRKEERK